MTCMFDRCCSLDDSVRARSPNGCHDAVDADALSTPPKVTTVHCIPIAQQMARRVAPGRCLHQLSPHPGGGRLGGDVDMHQLPPAMNDEDQHVQRLEGECRYREQVARPEVVSMVAQEGAPGLARCVRWSSPAVAPDGTIADDDAQLEQLASHALEAPPSVLAGHGPDEVVHLGAEMRTAAWGMGLPTPDEAPALPIPAHDRIRCHERQVLAPAGAKSPSQHPPACPTRVAERAAGCEWDGPGRRVDGAAAGSRARGPRAGVPRPGRS
jgi:hypothetical protein